MSGALPASFLPPDHPASSLKICALGKATSTNKSKAMPLKLEEIPGDLVRTQIYGPLILRF